MNQERWFSKDVTSCSFERELCHDVFTVSHSLKCDSGINLDSSRPIVDPLRSYLGSDPIPFDSISDPLRALSRHGHFRVRAVEGGEGPPSFCLPESSANFHLRRCGEVRAGRAGVWRSGECIVRRGGPRRRVHPPRRQAVLGTAQHATRQVLGKALRQVKPTAKQPGSKGQGLPLCRGGRVANGGPCLELRWEGETEVETEGETELSSAELLE